MRAHQPDPIAFRIGEGESAIAAPLVVARFIASHTGDDEPPVGVVDVVRGEIKLGGGRLTREAGKIRVTDLEDRDDPGLRYRLVESQHVAIEDRQSVEIACREF